MRGGDLRVDGFDGREQRDFGLGDAERVGKVDRVLDNVNLVFELGLDIDGCVGDQEGYARKQAYPSQRRG